MRVSKWGNSLAVRLPQSLVSELSLKPGDEIAVVGASRERLAVIRDDSRRRALDRMAKRNWRLPADYAFDRDEANER